MSTVASAVKSYPIPMHARSVVGILEGRKTQTRRIITRALKHPSWTGWMMTFAKDGAIECGPDYPDDDSYFVRCRYGKPGDHLWVRESWRTVERESDMVAGVLFKADNSFHPIEKSQAAADKWMEAYNNGKHGTKWRSGRFMPRWASRLMLEITDIRVERVQDISEQDCKSEGVTNPMMEINSNFFLRDAFCELWDDTNGTGAWFRNDFCWVISFRRIP